MPEQMRTRLRMQVLPGARVPADGEVVVGSSYVDESMITGEPAPVAKRSGDPLISGAHYSPVDRAGIGAKVKCSMAECCSHAFAS